VIPIHILDQLMAAGWQVRSSRPTETAGLKSDTFVIEHEEGTAILKIYNGKGGAPAAKCQREWLALGALEGVQHIPHRLCHAPDAWLLMEHLPGGTLRSQWEALEERARRRLCVDVGVAYGHIACAPQDALVHELVRQSRPVAWMDSLPRALAEIERLLQHEPRVAGSTFAASAEHIRILTNAAGAQELLIKADCNPDNTLATGGILSGIIDWEQACIGNRWIHFGIVLDHTHFLNWEDVRAGIEDVSGPWSRHEEDLVLAAGFLCVWRKIFDFLSRSASFGDPARQESRMRAMAAAMRRPDALP
jgi:aminoglycoside phosphotransferase (APT) family kinase protein